MKLIKITILVLMLLLMGSVLTVLFSLEKEDYSKGLVWTVHQFSDYQIESIDITSIDIAKNPSILLKDLRVRTASGDQKIIADFVEIQFSLMSLFSERLDIKKLIVRNAEIAVNNQVDFLDMSSHELSIPIIEYTELVNVHLVCECQDAKQLELDIEDVSIFDNGSGEISISGIGEFEQAPFHLMGRLGSSPQSSPQDPLFPILVTFQISDSSFLVQGSLEDPLELKGFNVDVTGDMVELSDITQHFINDVPPALGQAHLKFALKGDWDDLQITDLEATLKNNMGIDIRTDDSIKNLNLQLFGENEVIINVTGAGQFKSGKKLHPSDATLDLAITMTSPSTVGLFGKQLPEMGSIVANAKLKLTHKALLLSDINIISGNEEQLKVVVSGELDEFTFGTNIYQTALNLDVEVSGKSIEHLVPIKDKLKHIAGIDLLTAKLNLSGSLNQSELNVDNITIHHTDGISLQTHGKVKLGNLRQPDPIKDILLQVDGRVGKMQVLAPWAETKLPLLGEVRLTTNIQGNGSHFSLQDLQINVGNKSSVWMKFEGDIQDIHYAEEIMWSGLTLKAEFQESNSNQLVTYLGIPLPDIEKTYGSFNLSGNSEALAITDLNFTVINLAGIHLAGSGSIKQAGLLKHNTLSGIDIDLIADADSNTSLKSIIELDLPDLGALHIRGRLIEHQNELKLENIVLIVGNSHKPVIHATGEIENISNNQGLSLNVQIEIEPAVFLDHILDRKISEMGIITANILISNHDGSFGIESLELSSNNTTDLYQLTAKGVFDDFHQGDELEFNVDLIIPKPKLLGEKMGYNVADFEAMQFIGHVEGNNEELMFKGELDIGKTYFESNIIASYLDNYPVIKGTLHTKHLDLKDLAIHHEKMELKRTEPKNDRLFSSEVLPFDLIKNIDLDIHVSADEIKGTQFNIDTADAHVQIKNNVLTIKPFRLNFDDGFVNMNISIDVDNEPAYIALDVQARNIDIGALSSQLIEESYIEGDLTAHANISGRGYSLAEISASLDGDIATALDNGVLHEANLSLLNIDFVGWFFDHLVQKQQTDIHCAMSHYQVKQGLVDVNMLIVTSPDLDASAEGSINLIDETMNLTFYTDDKSLFRPKIPISINGDITNPTVTILPGINTLTSVVFSVVPEFILADVVLSKFWDLITQGDADSKCKEFLL